MLKEQIRDWRQRFEAFVARKEREARAATISPFVSELEPGGCEAAANRSQPGAVREPRLPRDLIAIGNDWTRRLFDGPFYASARARGDLPCTNLVFVQSRDGNTVAKDPSSIGGGDADKHLIYEGLSRVAADAVMAGAETVRSGNIVLSTWHPQIVALRASLGLPRHPIQIVTTVRGLDFGGILFNVPDVRVMLLTVPRSSRLMAVELARRPWIVPIVMPVVSDLPAAFHQLRQRGIHRISCIGGRTLAAQLLDAGLVQDVYLTTSLRIAGEPNTPLYAKPLNGEVIVRKRGTAADTGVVFEHIRLK
jgi:5-amino-6-(5-phosphoribosylamino)uracil reductase